MKKCAAEKGMTLSFIGLGIGNLKDITLKGLEAVKEADIVYLENYTAILGSSKEDLGKLYGKEIILASRDLVEKDANQIIQSAKEKNIAFLVVGDPFGATTHTDLVLRARKQDIDVKIIHNASIMNAIGEVGLELYKFGKTTSIVFPDEEWKVTTHYDVVKENLKRGLHTLCLLDIKVAEPRKEDLREGKQDVLKPRFMSVNQALRNLRDIEHENKEGVLSPDTLVVGVARLGQADQMIRAGPIKELIDVDFGKPLHSLIIPGKLHFVEEEMLGQWQE